MISEDKLMMRLLRDFLICKIYVQKGISTRNISSKTDIPVAIVKRALNVVTDRKEDLIRLLPQAFKKVKDDNLIKEEQTVTEELLSRLEIALELEKQSLIVNSKYVHNSIAYADEDIILVKNIHHKYCENKRDLVLTINQVKQLRDADLSYGQIALKLGISKSLAHKYYNLSDEEVLSLGEKSAKKR